MKAPATGAEHAYERCGDPLIIERIPGTHRYRITARGLPQALFLSRVHARLVRPGPNELAGDSPEPSPLRRAP